MVLCFYISLLHYCRTLLQCSIKAVLLRFCAVGREQMMIAGTLLVVIRKLVSLPDNLFKQILLIFCLVFLYFSALMLKLISNFQDI